MSYGWLSTAETAGLLGLSERRTRDIAPSRFRVRMTDGGRRMEIDPRTLPGDAREAWERQTLPDLDEVEAATDGDDPETYLRALDRATARTRRTADKWTLILARTEGIRGTAALETWCDAWNAEHPDMRTSAPSIYRQRAIVAECGRMGLVGDRQQARTTVPDALYEAFRGAYLRPNKISATAAWMIARGTCEAAGVDKDEMPSVSAFIRRLKKETAPDVIFYCREGKKKFYDVKSVHVARDYEDVQAGQVWVGDTRTWDVFVKLPEFDIPKTCYITLFLDMRTYMPMGWQLHADAPSTDNTLRALRNGIERYGLPTEILVDNGREYRNADFSGQTRGHRICEDTQRAEAMATRFGIKMHFAVVRNARAKIIERMFLKIKNGFDKMFSSYKGGSVAEKPETLKGVLKSGDYVTWDEFRELADKYMTEVYPAWPCNGREHQGRSPAAMWNGLIAHREPMPRISAESLRMITSRTADGTIGRNGFHLASLDCWYWGEWMPLHKGETAMLRYDPADMSEASCLDAAGGLLGTCRLTRAVGAMVRPDDDAGKARIAEAMQRRRHEEKVLREIAPRMTRGMAREYIDALSRGVDDPGELLIPEGPLKATRHDADADAVRADAAFGDPARLAEIHEDRDERKKYSIFGDDDDVAIPG